MKKISKIIFFTLLCFWLLDFTEISAQTTQTRPTWWATHIDSTGLHNLQKLNDTVYRSEQPDSAEFVKLKQLGIKSILNIRTENNDSIISGNQQFYYYSVPMKADKFGDEEIIKVLQIIHDAPKPVLIHCLHGSDRTGAVLAMYRIIYESRTKQEALDELLNGGYGFNTIFINIPAYIKKVDIEKIKNGLKLN